MRTVVVHARPVDDNRQAVGEVRPRYESELSFRVAGKVLARLVDVGAMVKRGDILARLDTQDYQNRLRSAEAEVAAAEAALVEAQADEARKAKLLKDGWTPRATYDSVVQKLRTAEARLTVRQGQSRTQPRSAPLHRAQGRVRWRDHRSRGRSRPERRRRPDGRQARPPRRNGWRLQHRRDDVRFTVPRTSQRSSSGLSPIPSSRSRARSARSRRSPMPQPAPTPSRSRSRTHPHSCGSA